MEGGSCVTVVEMITMKKEGGSCVNVEQMLTMKKEEGSCVNVEEEDSCVNEEQMLAMKKEEGSCVNEVEGGSYGKVKVGAWIEQGTFKYRRKAKIRYWRQGKHGAINRRK